MSEPEIQRASRVCSVCAARKKTCDKALPACGFCTNRGLRCRYDEPASGERRVRNYNPGRHFVAVGNLEATRATTATTRLQQSVGQQVIHLLELVDLSPMQVMEVYFRFSYQWPPIISPRSLSSVASGTFESADLAILLLAMTLLVKFPELADRESGAQLSISKEYLYASTKSVFGQAQASIDTSVPLLQAGLLISTFEYVSGRPSAAYITLATCRAMMQVLDFDSLESKPPGGSHEQRGDDNTSARVDNFNVRWAIMMLERIALCEMLPKCIDPSTESPGTLLTQDVNEISGLGQQAQAMIFIDRVLWTARSLEGNRDGTLAQLEELDNTIRDFLTVIVAATKSPAVVRSPASLPLTLRALFLLHHLIITAIQQKPQAEVADQAKIHASQAVLDMISNMALDLARYGSDVGSLPICCYYNLKAAVEWIRSRGDVTGDRPPAAEVELLSQILDGYCGKWMIE